MSTRCLTAVRLVICLGLLLVAGLETYRLPALQLATLQAAVTRALTLEDELAYLLSCQLPEGAIAQSPEHQRVIPYFANLAARTLVPHAPERVREYILWYLAHLNLPDRWQLHGTIYDFKVVEGRLVPTRDYDSADSYAATFLSLVWEYAEHTGDWELIQRHRDQLETVAGVILDLQDADGLVWAKSQHRVKYLMDNAENYRGLTDGARIMHQLGAQQKADELTAHAGDVRQGLEQLWIEHTQEYAWGYSFWGLRQVRQGRWYPDKVAQLYPLLNGMVSSADLRPQLAYQRLNAAFPAWAEGQLPDPFPWTVIAYAALRLGDEARARLFLESVAENFAQRERPYPWYILESAYTIKLLRSLEHRP